MTPARWLNRHASLPAPSASRLTGRLLARAIHFKSPSDFSAILPGASRILIWLLRPRFETAASICAVAAQQTRLAQRARFCKRKVPLALFHTLAKYCSNRLLIQSSVIPISRHHKGERNATADPPSPRCLAISEIRFHFRRIFIFRESPPRGRRGLYRGGYFRFRSVVGEMTGKSSASWINLRESCGLNDLLHSSVFHLKFKFRAS